MNPLDGLMGDGKPSPFVMVSDERKPAAEMSLRNLIAEYLAYQEEMGREDALPSDDSPEGIQAWNERMARTKDVGKEAAGRLGVYWNDFVMGAPIGVWKQSTVHNDDLLMNRKPTFGTNGVISAPTDRLIPRRRNSNTKVFRLPVDRGKLPSNPHPDQNKT
jgi:hypothetical protein